MSSTKRIVYRDPDNGRAIILDPLDTETGRTIEEIAIKDVPTGCKFKIIDIGDVLTDRSFRNAWTVEESDLTDGAGG
tara:strand:- start:102 stop:332 length:231 start_codon:yes stop_codon:yes gene_type:complete